MGMKSNAMGIGSTMDNCGLGSRKVWGLPCVGMGYTAKRIIESLKRVKLLTVNFICNLG